jgi:hypothetical protein
VSEGLSALVAKLCGPRSKGGVFAGRDRDRWRTPEDALRWPSCKCANPLVCPELRGGVERRGNRRLRRSPRTASKAATVPPPLRSWAGWLMSWVTRSRST